jgi:hypothetical protein
VSDVEAKAFWKATASSEDMAPPPIMLRGWAARSPRRASEVSQRKAKVGGGYRWAGPEVQR